MQGFDKLFGWAVGIGIAFLPITLLVGIGYGALVAGSLAIDSASRNRRDLAQKLLEHGDLHFCLPDSQKASTNIFMNFNSR